MQKVNEYEDGIFVLEVEEGGNISDIRAVRFSEWDGTVGTKLTKPIRFFAKVVGFEDDEAPQRNWHNEEELADFLKKEEIEEALESLL